MPVLATALLLARDERLSITAIARAGRVRAFGDIRLQNILNHMSPAMN